MDFAAHLNIQVDSDDALRASKNMGTMVGAGKRAELNVKKSMMEVTGSMRDAANRTGQHSMRMERQSRQAVNNLSYQLTDIAQMLAVGQNPFVTMMQQGEQTAGAMRDLSRHGGPIAGLKAAIGTIINPVSLVTFGLIGLSGVLVRWFTSAGEEVQTFEDHVNDLATSFKDYKVHADASMESTQELAEKYGQAADAAKLLHTQLLINRRLEMENSTRMGFQEAQIFGGTVMSGLMTREIAAIFDLERPMLVFTEATRAARDEVDALAKNIIDAQNQMASSENISEQVIAAEQMMAAYVAAADASGSRSTEELLYIDNLGKTLDLLYQFQKLEEDRTSQATMLQGAYTRYYESLVKSEEFVANAAKEALARKTQMYAEYYDSRVAAALFAANAERDALTRQTQMYAQYYDSLVQAALFAANAERDALARQKQMYAQYYDSLVQAALFAANAERDALTRQTQMYAEYYDSRVAAALFAANAERDALTRQTQMYVEYYDSLVRAALFAANTERDALTRQTQAYSEYYASRISSEQFIANAEQATLSRQAQQYKFFADSRVQGQAIADKAEELLTTYNLQTAVANAILVNGQNSVEATAARFAIEERSLRTQLEAEGITGSMQQNIVDAARATSDAEAAASGLKDQLSDSVNQAISLRDVMVSASSAIDGIGQNVQRRLAVARARGVALANGTDATIAGQVALERRKLNEQVTDMVAGGSSVDRAVESTMAVRTEINELESLLSSNKALQDQQRANASTSGGGSGQRSATDQERDALKLAQTLQEMEFDADPLKKYAHELEILNGLQEAGLSSGAYKHALDELNSTLEETSELNMFFKDASEDLFDGIKNGADSAKEALKGVLQELLSIMANKAFRSIVDGVGGEGGAGFGGLVSGFFSGLAGGKTAGTMGGLKAHANGGVVNTPTPFNMSGGRTGLMGEAGPEGILPLTRGSNGRLGVDASGSASQKVEIVLRAPEGFTADQVGQMQGISVQVLQSATPQIMRQAVAGAQASFINSKSGWSP